MNDAVIFRSAKFSLIPPLSERGVPYDLPLGDDVAEFLLHGTCSTHPEIQHSPVTREDFGSVVDLMLEGRTYTLTITWIADRDHEDRWGIQFSRPVGFWGFLLGRRSRPEDCRDAQNLIADVLRKNPEVFTDVEWLSQEQFSRKI
jgi:hypothetical protein